MLTKKFYEIDMGKGQARLIQESVTGCINHSARFLGQHIFVVVVLVCYCLTGILLVCFSVMCKFFMFLVFFFFVLFLFLLKNKQNNKSC